MNRLVPTEIRPQLSLALDVIQRHLPTSLMAVHLYGSALYGGLKPLSDIDLLVTASAKLDEAQRRSLVADLLRISAPPGDDPALRALEVTLVLHTDIAPWRYPPLRHLQFGEWQRQDILAGIIEADTLDPDLAILFAKARQHSIALVGPPADRLFAPVPKTDFYAALSTTLDLWRTPDDWSGDERHVLLTLARVWYSAATGAIAPKDMAADWALARLPETYRPLLWQARQAYLGHAQDRFAAQGQALTAAILHMKSKAAAALAG
ncbi:aminoglycoside adenylyltransferase family protein [Bordetella pseudohinzii]|uniref:Aminoglycoside (3'') (9) adenylyltransferase n=1 Tax=Bordetella pseudohinzii TaxID=1331258 RepID=A0A0J6C8N6_9BORD|nr:aminoglycoside nucleotidyltransferase [Bordetella pseudohinzii]ANY17513.1 ANT(3'') family aminoglycoside nucleotidyltransferase [Bordetella pseudohinzii]KMM25742.1 adenylyltransferase [Bordetella pseudohinzii]KXA81730.1 adenylyltransferase [Bordetella pseudohinzii]KXA83030.1 adenylyltransferase [Bordetella pseudohinzii]CUI72864.1 Streptomycin 3''-adenylyltransferase [Bordetella pseudohinzii]